MIYLKTKTKDLGRKDSVRIANMALRWCRRTLGTNNRKRLEPIWYVLNGFDDDPACGCYDCWDNEVYIFWDHCDTVKELIATCIHEWTHQNQPIRSKYYSYPSSYSRNPYERAAKYAEWKWVPVAWKELKNKINRK
jgi:hypothetical protein